MNDIEVVGNNVVYKGIVSVSLETVQAQRCGPVKDELYEYMARVYEEHMTERRDSRITDILGDDNKS
jgi:hypothetical protein